MVGIDFYALSALINFITSTLLGTVVLSQRKVSRSNVFFVFFTYSVALWSLFYFFWQTATSSIDAIRWAQLFLASASLIPIFFFHFVVSFSKLKTTLLQVVTVIGYLFGILFLALSFTNLLIQDVTMKLSFEYWPEPGLLFPVFLVVWFFYLFCSFIILFKQYHTSNSRKKLQTYLLLLGMSVGFLGGATNYFLWYDIPILPFGNILVSFYVLLVAYAIIKHKLFNLKVILAEVAVLMLWLITVARTLLSETIADFMLNIIYVIFVTIFGAFVVYNVRSEVAQREEIEKLMTGLAKANRRLQAIDKQKSEFISVASHQLRSPLTAIRGYASMLTEGSFGKFPKKAHKPLETIAESARMMAISIEDYLSVSRIEAGNMKFNYSDFNIVEQAERVTDSLRPQATKQGLLLTFKRDVTSSGEVHADQGKVEQIIHNLVNNALKYTPKGSITVYVHDDLKQKRIYVEVIDTGIGMSQEAQEQLFSKFQRANNAVTVNVHGTGLGLYVAKKMASEMKGDVYGYSEGEGKGSYFILELPLLQST